ncbi:MAG: uroporphyrinogen decarboxylase family protein [Dehalobacterium sp.]
MSDQMQSDQRVVAMFKGEELDRVPVIPFMFGHIAVVNGIPISEVYENGKASFKAQTRAAEFYGYDRLNIYAYAMYGGWEFGGEIRLPRKEGESPVVAKYAAETMEQAEKLQVPENILEAGCIPINLEFSNYQAEEGVPVSFQANGPLTMASCMVGVEKLMMWMIEAPEIVHHLSRISTDFSLQLCDQWIKKFGAENLMPIVGCATESNKLISPKHFEEFVFPYMNEMLDKFSQAGIKKCFSHLCSEQKANLPYFGKMPWPQKSLFSFGIETPLQFAAQHLPNHIMGGHVDPLIIRSGNPDQVLEDSRKSIEEGKDLAGFALMPGCDIPAYSPPINVFQMVKAARVNGWN